MSENGKSGLHWESAGSPDTTVKLIDRLFDVASPAGVFSEPVQSGDYTVIMASEVNVGMGAGFGSGYDAGDGGEVGGGGGGGGGGGFSAGRPVAVIEVGPAGVRVEPIVDPTKIAIAFFTTFAAVFVAIGRVRRQALKLAGRD